jgi:tetratricopeptide (TPR) repeat protein
MSPRFHALAWLSAAALALLSPMASAQTVAPPGPPAPGQAIEPMQPPKDLPRPQRGDRTRNLDFLFGALKAAPDAESAKQVENRIWALWLASGSDTANLLMTRAKSAIDSNDLDLAVQLLDAIVKIKPDYIEAWNRRATLHYMRKEYGQSMDDIRQVLIREPRHFGAMSGLGMILQEFGDEKHALDVFRRALEINPHLPKIDEMVKGLTEKVEGRGI